MTTAGNQTSDAPMLNDARMRSQSSWVSSPSHGRRPGTFRTRLGSRADSPSRLLLSTAGARQNQVASDDVRPSTVESSVLVTGDLVLLAVVQPLIDRELATCPLRQAPMSLERLRRRCRSRHFAVFYPSRF